MLEVEDQKVALGRCVDAAAGADVRLSLRPEALAVGSAGAGPSVSLAGRVEDVTFHGPIVRVRVAVGGQRLAVDSFNTAAFRPPTIGAPVVVAFDPADALVA